MFLKVLSAKICFTNGARNDGSLHKIFILTAFITAVYISDVLSLERGSMEYGQLNVAQKIALSDNFRIDASVWFIIRGSFDRLTLDS